MAVRLPLRSQSSDGFLHWVHGDIKLALDEVGTMSSPQDVNSESIPASAAAPGRVAQAFASSRQSIPALSSLQSIEARIMLTKIGRLSSSLHAESSL